MARYLVGSLTPEYWYLHPEIAWLHPEDAQADAVRDLRVQGNELSVYEIRDGSSTEHIKRIVVAIAAKGKQTPVDVGYRLIDPSELASLNIVVTTSEGTLGDDQANELHRDLTHISAKNLGKLAAIIARSEGGDVSAKEFERILRREVTHGRLKLRGIHPELRAHLGL